MNSRASLIFSQFGYIHAASRDATLAIQELGILNVFKPKCMSCNRMDDRQSCRESCAAYKRNPQNHIAAHNCKQGNCAVVLASACKNCIRNCDNIKSVSLSAAGKANPDVGDTSFENCYHTFGCASDCKAALKKVTHARHASKFHFRSGQGRFVKPNFFRRVFNFHRRHEL